MRKIVFLALFCVVMLVSSVAYAVMVDGPGGFGNDPYVWISPGEYETPDLVLYDEHTSNWQWGSSDPIVGTAYGMGDIQADNAATVKASSELNYHDPYGSGELTIGSDIETWKPFQVTSDSKDPGSKVPVSIGVGYHGTLQATEGVAGKSSWA